MTQKVVMSTDGACSGNPGPGGWGVVLRYGDAMRELYGGMTETTNNRMELMAAIEALRALKRSCQVDLYTDSTYERYGDHKELHWLAANGWKAPDKTAMN